MAITKATLSDVAGGLLGDAVNVISGYGDYKTAREQGDSRTMAATKAFASFAWGEMYYGGMQSALSKGFGKVLGAKGGNVAATIAMVGVSVAQAGIGIAGSVWENNTKKMTAGYAMRGKLGSGQFDMTQAGYTMRQRSLNAIRSNGLNTQSVLGNEARTFMRSYN